MIYKCSVCGYEYDEEKEGNPFPERPKGLSVNSHRKNSMRWRRKSPLRPALLQSVKTSAQMPGNQT